jgi:lipopolysaccharide export LptBFGC system permease protein LptF
MPQRTYVVYADRLAGSNLVAEHDEQLIIEAFHDGARIWRASAGRASLVQDQGDRMQSQPYELELEEVEITNVDSNGAIEQSNVREQLTLPGLDLAGGSDTDFQLLDSRELRQRVAAMGSTSSRIDGAVSELDRAIRQLRQEILARLLKRFAFSLTPLLLLGLGAVAAMWLRDSLPLTTYIWSFIPALLNTLLITAGEQLVRDDQPWFGFGVMWSGNGVLVALFVVFYRRLSRH